jgi:hypothetical protein
VAGKLQAADPPFELGLKARGRVFGEHTGLQATQERARFLFAKAQILDAEFQQLTAGTVASDWQRDLTTTSEHEVKTRREVIDEEDERLIDRLTVEQVAVVKDEDDVIVDFASDIDESRQDVIDGRRHRAEEEPDRGLLDARLHLLPRDYQVAQKALEVIVVFFE